MELREVEALMTELESRTDRLRALYEQYFLGFERLEPSVPRKDVERRFQQLLKVPFRNTALRFRFTMLQQRYNTYQTYWMRTCRKIEDGTYKRQIQRMKAKDADYLRNVEAAKKEDVSIEIAEVDEFELDEDVESVAPTLPPPKLVAATEEPTPKKAWSKPPAGSTFDTRPTTPRMKAVRLPVATKKDDDKTPKPADTAPVDAAAAEPKTSPPPMKPKAQPPPVPTKVKIATVPNEMHSRPTTPRMQAVRLPEKGK